MSVLCLFLYRNNTKLIIFIIRINKINDYTIIYRKILVTALFSDIFLLSLYLVNEKKRKNV